MQCFWLMYSLAMAKELDLGDGILYITDQKNMVDIMSANIVLNENISQIEASELDWYIFLSSYSYNRATPIPDHLASPDIILAADCVYFEPAFPLLQETLCRLTDGRDVEVYMAYKKRRKVCA
jgi:protein N-lysine methyltransferase METTL21A